MIIINTINLKTIQDLFNYDITSVQKYTKSLSCSLKETEIKDISSLVTGLEEIDIINSGICNSFFCGYTIPNISKEFDLLRFGEKCIINIELKSTSTEEKVEKQLIQNRYYLEFLNKDLILYSYVRDENKLYKLNENNKIEITNFKTLYYDLDNQELEFAETTTSINIDSKFKLSNYLVSPFNSTDKFIEGKYFLTSQQSVFKQKILDYIENEKNYNHKIIAIEGNAGTGKTLLTYDIAREFIENGKKTLIIHCGFLNDGHKTLIDKYGMNIIEVKNTCKESLEEYDLIIIDEFQRIRTAQLNKIIKSIRENNNSLLVSFDPKQCLSKNEIDRKSKERIEKHITRDIFKLSNKIRTNPEISKFISCLFDLNKKNDNPSIKNLKKYIKIEYFQELDDAKVYINYLKGRGWKPLPYTNSIKDYESISEYSDIGDQNSHSVIGQEFDNVLVIVDSNFKHDNKRLVCKQTYYDLNSMLFQNITRTREKLCIIIVDNPEMFDTCMDIINIS